MKIYEETVERYSNRYKKLGYDVKTLGWGSVEQQEYRFSQTLDIDFKDKSIVDIGCGFLETI
jgi:predicted alpha/beta hydrolase